MTSATLQELSSSEINRLLSIINKLSGTLDKYTLRREIAEDLLRLLHSDFIASYIWEEDRKKFIDAVFLNMSPENISRYDAHYQFCDPITFLLQKNRRATLVCDVMPQKELEKTEFFNDFLMVDGLHHGINIYAYDGNVNIGDLRIWREKNRPEYGIHEKRILDTLLPYFRNALRNARALSETQKISNTWERILKTTKTSVFLFGENGHLNYRNTSSRELESSLNEEIYKTLFEQIISLSRGDLSHTVWGPFSLSVLSTRSPKRGRAYKAILVQRTNPSRLGKDYLRQKYGLSPREAEISLLVCKGLIDREIASAMGISFSTVRTHLKRIFRKVDVTTRTELVFVLIENHVTIAF
jgi:DNA-binding CsgD family transcriptional regulator